MSTTTGTQVGLPAMLALAFLMGGTAFSVDSTLATFPAVAEAFGVEVAAAQQTVGACILGFALGQIPVGLMADRFGRRPVLIWGMFLFIVSAFLASTAGTVEMLLALRFLQGVFAASGAVLSRTMARDLTSGAEAVRLMGFLSSFVGLAMVLAPILGGAILWVAGWRMTFGASAIYGGIGLVLALFNLPETRPPQAGMRTVEALRSGVQAFAASPRSCFSVFLVALSFAALMGFVTLASDVFIRDLGYGALGFGVAYAIISMGYVGSGLVVHRLARSVPRPALIRHNALAFLLAGALLCLTLAVPRTGAALNIPALTLFVAAAGSMIALGTAAAMEDLPKTAGVAAGLMGTAQLGIGGLISLGVTALSIDRMPELALLLAGMGAVAALYALFLARWVMGSGRA